MWRKLHGGRGTQGSEGHGVKAGGSADRWSDGLVNCAEAYERKMAPTWKGCKGSSVFKVSAGLLACSYSTAASPNSAAACLLCRSPVPPFSSLLEWWDRLPRLLHCLLCTRVSLPPGHVWTILFFMFVVCPSPHSYISSRTLGIREPIIY